MNFLHGKQDFSWFSAQIIITLYALAVANEASPASTGHIHAHREKEMVRSQIFSEKINFF